MNSYQQKVVTTSLKWLVSELILNCNICFLQTGSNQYHQSTKFWEELKECYFTSNILSKSLSIIGFAGIPEQIPSQSVEILSLSDEYLGGQSRGTTALDLYPDCIRWPPKGSYTPQPEVYWQGLTQDRHTITKGYYGTPTNPMYIQTIITIVKFQKAIYNLTKISRIGNPASNRR